MPPKCFESEVESFLEGSHGDRTHNKQRADHHTVTPLCGTLLRRARAGFEIDHSEPQARVWRSRGRPGPTAPGTPVGPQATQAGRPPPTGTHSDQAPLVWRAPEGPAAVPVGGGGAWPGFETTRRAKLAARTTRGRDAAHRHTQRPGPTAPGTPRGTTSNTAQGRGPAGPRP